MASARASARASAQLRAGTLSYCGREVIENPRMDTRCASNFLFARETAPPPLRICITTSKQPTTTVSTITSTNMTESKRNSPGVIEDQRAKCNMIYREFVAPGLCIEMDLKGILASQESKFQKVDILSTHFGKTLITDGKTQSTEFDEFAYHESLVHPAMLKALSSGPVKKVFIGGGGELATAREVLRYAGVEKVVMVDLDEVVVNFCKEHLPEWGGEAVASNPRLELVIGDAYKYLAETKEMFDVIIMDISDPIECGPGIMLYTKEFYDHAKTLLNPHGVFVTQGGTAEAVPSAVVSFVESEDPSCFAPIANTLSAVFSVTVPYSTNIPSFGGDWGFVMAFEGNEPADSWTAPGKGAIDNLIEKHIAGGSSALKLYDGISHLTMFNLTKPLRAYMAKDERVMTRDNPVFMF